MILEIVFPREDAVRALSDAARIRGSKGASPSRKVCVKCLSRLMLAVWLTMLATVAMAADVKREFIRQAPEILRHCRERGYKNVGILKFRIRKGQGQPTDNAGPLNMNLADQLELALIMANDVRNPLGIIHDASAVAAKVKGANHLTVEGRELLFSETYPLAWGDSRVRPDAFLVGVVEMRGSLDSFTVGVAAFSPGKEGLEKVVQFTATPGVDDLIEVGESFAVRGLFDAGKLELADTVRQEIVTHAAAVHQASAPHPLVAPEASAVLDILYDNRIQTVEYRGGEAYVKEPETGQKVSFVIRRKNPADKQRYGVVLKVNGENTLARQRLKDLDCRKWILEPGDPPITLHGFQITDDSAQEFRVLSKAESKAREMDYGRDVGTISFVVFRELTHEPVHAPVLAAEDEDFGILSRGVFPSQPVPTLDVLKQKLLADSGTRGLIVEGERIHAATRKVKFRAEPTPILSATIRYYHP